MEGGNKGRKKFLANKVPDVQDQDSRAANLTCMACPFLEIYGSLPRPNLGDQCIEAEALKEVKMESAATFRIRSRLDRSDKAQFGLFE